MSGKHVFPKKKRHPNIDTGAKKGCIIINGTKTTAPHTFNTHAVNKAANVHFATIFSPKIAQKIWIKMTKDAAFNRLKINRAFSIFLEIVSPHV